MASGSRAGGSGRLFGHDFPALALGDRAAFADAHLVADLEAIGLVVGGVLLRARDELLVDRVHDAPLDQDRYGLVALVAHHLAQQDSPRHLACSSTGAATWSRLFRSE